MISKVLLDGTTKIDQSKVICARFENNLCRYTVKSIKVEFAWHTVTLFGP